MNKIGITPGPWRVERTGDNMPYIETEDGEENIACIMSFNDPGGVEANARLISAAPELLEAVIGFRQMLTRSEYLDPIIEKATGKPWEEIKEG